MKVTLTKVGMMVAAVALTSGFTSCKKEGCTDATATNYSEEAKKDDGTCTYATTASNEVTKTGFITSNETWTADKIYLLDQKVVVNSGVTLTIEPGTIIKGKEGSDALASALVIPQGAKINAVGTATKPIIFTSVLDNIEIGQTTGTNLTSSDKGKWGGLIILGNAKISASSGDDVSQIEGIPASESYGAYGGSDDADNSGTLQFVSIRHGGALIGAGNEINGLTLGGVGSATSISDIEIVSNLDDGIEFFGGSVDVTNLLVAYCGDDAIDLDQNYSGTVTNFIVIQDTDSDEGLELDGTEGTTYTNGTFKLFNGSVYSKDGGGTPADLKDKAQGDIINVKFSGYTNGNLKIRASYDNDCSTVKTDACSNLISATPKLTITGSELAGVEVYTKSVNSSSTACPVTTTDAAAATAAVTSTTAAGVSNTIFSWGWTQANNKF